MLTLYPDQQANFEQLRDAFRRHRAVLFQAPTGYGKTAIGCHIAAGAAARGTRTVFVVHREELIDQTCDAFERCGIRHGVIAPHARPTEHDIQVASVFTLARRRVRAFDLVIFDEAHHCAAGSWECIRATFPEAAYLGLTATPVRLDGRGLAHAFETMLHAPSMRQLIDMGRLSPYEYWMPCTVDMSGIRSSHGDWQRSALAVAMSSRTITGNCISHYKRICDGAPFIAFCATVNHARAVAEEFRAAGYPVDSVDGTMERAQRREIVRSLGVTRVGITSCDLISEGFDVPAVVAAILLRPTKSLGLHLQQVGRALRVCPGKSKAVILDCVGNVLRHGLPDAERTWSLQGVQPRTQQHEDEDGPDVRACPKCHAVHVYAPSCPYCGYEYPVRVREVEQVEGELRQVTPEEIDALWTAVGKRNDLSTWHKLAKATGRKPGWAWGQWKRKRAGNALKAARI